MRIQSSGNLRKTSSMPTTIQQSPSRASRACNVVANVVLPALDVPLSTTIAAGRHREAELETPVASPGIGLGRRCRRGPGRSCRASTSTSPSSSMSTERSAPVNCSIVRGPMIGAVTTGLASSHASATSAGRSPMLRAQRLPRVERVAQPFGRRLHAVTRSPTVALPDGAGEQSAAQADSTAGCRRRRPRRPGSPRARSCAS